jgi:hypothetical protein
MMIWSFLFIVFLKIFMIVNACPPWYNLKNYVLSAYDNYTCYKISISQKFCRDQSQVCSYLGRQSFYGASYECDSEFNVRSRNLRLCDRSSLISIKGTDNGDYFIGLFH